jgi:N-methylhydantoinase B
LELVYKALAQGMPDRLAASSGGDVPSFAMVGIHPETKRLFVVSNNDGVGWGATANHDGSNAASHLSGNLMHNTPIEVLEMKTGMFMENLELRTDSGGAGKFRGGLGLRRDVRFVSDGELISVRKKTKTRPWSIAGGREAEPHGMFVYVDTHRERRGGTYRAKVAAGDRARSITAGGGGYGYPEQRDPARVLEDVLDGYVSRVAAREIYKVVVTGNGIDVAETRKLRMPGTP